MALLTGDELRLLYAILLNAAALWAGWRVGRRLNRDDHVAAAGDALLVYYLIQYVSVCVAGVVAALNPLTIAAVALVVSAAVGLSAGRVAKPPAAGFSLPLIAACAFVLSYLAGVIWIYCPAPVMSNDAITYHLPAAVQWLQSGTLGLYETWYYNPANSYSPLAGSVFSAWQMAPMGNDALARFVQVGPLLMLFVALANLCRRLGAEAGVAAIVAGSVVLTRSFASQAVLSKDDLFVAAFFVLAVDAVGRERLAERFGALRAGAAIGLLLATKYTVLLSLPLLLLMLNSAWTWRRVAIIAGCAILLAGPWYLRNMILTGNPLYPTEIRLFGATILSGMMCVQRSDLLKSISGVWSVFVGGYYGLTVPIAAIAILGWLAAMPAAGRRLWRDPLTRTCLLGAPVGIALFILTAPYGEMRFAYPSLALLLASITVALMVLRPWVAGAIAALIAILAAATAFLNGGVKLTAFALICTAAVVGIVVLAHRFGLSRRVVRYSALAAAVGAALYGYVNLAAHVEGYEAVSTVAWRDRYGGVAEVWGYVRNELPRGATIAYANTYFTYPLMGHRHDHRVVHVSTRADVERFVDLPKLGEPMTGEEIVSHVVAAMRANPDRTKWLDRVRASGARYLVVAKQIPARGFETSPPPELNFVAGDPSFHRVFDNEAGSVFEMKWQ